VLEVARIDLLDRKNDEHIRRAELPVDHRAVTHERPEPQIALHQRRQRLQRGPGIHLVRRQPIHRHVQMAVRAAAPLRRRQRIVVQEAQRHRVLVGIGAGETGATDHHIHLVLPHIGPQPVPEQFHRTLIAIGLEHA